MNSKHIIKDVLNFILVDEKIKIDLLSIDLMENKDRILNYLNNGYKVSTVATIRQCEICNKEAGAISYFSDGYWIWPKWLNHYLMEHNIKLPEKFLERMEVSNFQINKEKVEEIIDNENTFIG